MIIQTTIFIAVSTLLFPTICMSDPCRFEYPGKGVIDITTLGRTDGTAAYEDRVPSKPSGYKYSYNPCKPFSKGYYCTNVAVCQISIDGQYQYNLGAQGTASWNPGNETGNVPSVIYTHDVRTVIVKLQCSTTGAEEFEVLGEDPMNYYTFRLTHKCACWNGCSSTTSTTTTTVVPPSFTPCRFEYPGKGVIDFSFIGRTDEKAAYSDETTRAASNFKYSYNPCRSFSQGTSCIGVSVCQISNDEKKYTFTLGTQESASWNLGSDLDGVPSVNYAYADKKVTVLLQCSAEGNNEFQAFGEDPINNYKFQLTHKCACWNGCSNEPSTTTTTSTTITSTTSTTMTTPHESKWHTTGSMIEARLDPALTILKNGKVLVTGGGTSQFLRSAELYDPSTGNWTTTGSMYEERALHTASLLQDGKVLIAGGSNFRRTLVDSAELYDPSTGIWKPTGTMNVARLSHTATVLLDGKVLVVGGYGHDPIETLDSAEWYDPADGTWTPTGSMNKARLGHTASLLSNGKVLVAGGNEGKHEGPLNSAELYDPSTGNWTMTGSMSNGQERNTASTLANGKVLVAGYNAEVYDPSTGNWSSTGTMNRPRTEHAASVLASGEVLIAGGHWYDDYLNSAELYDPSTNTWKTTASMSTKRQQFHACTLTDVRVLVVGGMGGPDSAELFIP